MRLASHVARYPRTAALSITCVGLLLMLVLSLGWAGGATPRFVAYASACLGLACVADNVANLVRRRAADEQRLRTVETAWLECHIELRLLERWLRDHGVHVETQELAREELRRQLSLPSPNVADGDA